MTPFLIALLVCLPVLIAIPLIPYLRRPDTPWANLREQWFSFPISNSLAAIPFAYGVAIYTSDANLLTDRDLVLMVLFLPIGLLTLCLTGLALVGFFSPPPAVRHRRKGHLITLALCSPIILPVLIFMLAALIENTSSKH